jgi:hypothetical protein
VNYEVIEDKSNTGGPLTFVSVLIVLCVITFVQHANAQSSTDRDVSGTTWECRIESNNEDGGLTGGKNGDHVLITFDSGGSSITAKPLNDQAPVRTHNGKLDWSFGEWKQEGATVQSVSNGTLESFHDQPWNDGDAERMLELKISGDQMQGRLLSHSTTDLSVFHCQLQTLLPNSVSTGTNASPPVVPAAPVVDVRVTSADSRILTSAEMAALRDSLHWEPESVPLRNGGTAVSNLLDNQGHTLGSIRVQWTKTVASKGTRSQPADPPVGSFSLEIENGTSCGFLAQAELEGPKGSVIVSSVDIDSWVGLHQPGSGETIRVGGDAVLPNPNLTIVLRPLAVGSALSACLTPKRP